MRQRDLDDLNRLLAFYDTHKPNMKGQDVQTHLSKADVESIGQRGPGGKVTYKGYTILPAQKKRPRQ